MNGPEKAGVDAQRYRQMNVRVPEATLRVGRMLASKEGLTMSEWVSRLMTERILVSRAEVARELQGAVREATAMAQRMTEELDALALGHGVDDSRHAVGVS
jgi:hypothetical protein